MWTLFPPPPLDWDVRVNDLKTTAMHEMSTPPTPSNWEGGVNGLEGTVMHEMSTPPPPATCRLRVFFFSYGRVEAK